MFFITTNYVLNFEAIQMNKHKEEDKLALKFKVNWPPPKNIKLYTILMVDAITLKVIQRYLNAKQLLF